MKHQNLLPENFYTRDVLTVAKDLLGKIFVKDDRDKKYSGIIVEVEAYSGATDEAAHTFNGKTKRNEVMFEEGGLLYVYFTYGVHFCSNVVTGKEGESNAVLLRGIQPINGIEFMAMNRFGKKNLSYKEKINLANGPGKICQAFNIKREHNGSDLLGDNIFILDNKKVADSDIVTTTRIGIKKSVDLPWRFYIKDNTFVSRK